MFSNLLVVINDEKYQAVLQKLPTLMEEYYEQVDAVEKKRIRESAKNKFQEIMMNHKKFELAQDKLDEEAKAAAGGEEQKRGAIEEENKNKNQMEKLQGWEDKYAELGRNKKAFGQLDAKDQE